MNNKCFNIRKLILESSQVELLTPELEEAKIHLKECMECQSFFTEQNELRKLIKDNLPKAKAPVSLREEVLQAISKRKKSVLNKNSSKNLIKYSAAVILLTFTILLFFDPFDLIKSNSSTYITNFKSEYNLTEELINDYIRFSLSEQPIEFATNNPQELNNWFSRKVDFNVRFSSVDDLRLVGGRLCYLFNRRVALGFYSPMGMHKSDQRASLFIFKDNHLDLSKMKTGKLKNRTVWFNEIMGYELTIWKQNDLLYALVADANCTILAEKLLERI